MPTVNLVIDGKAIQAEEGMTILQAAKAEGIEIPTLCYYEPLQPYGACRVCVVEVTRGKKTTVVVSCAYPVREGIEVKTHSEKIIRIRKMIAELLLARCPDSKEVRQFAQEMDVTETRFEKGDETCTLCGLCVRTCRELMGRGAIGFTGRGTTRKVSPPFEENSLVCMTCGACEFVCPTKAIGPTLVSGREPPPIASTFDRGLKSRPAMRFESPQAVPNAPVIDREHCAYFLAQACRACEKVCPPRVIDFEQQDETVEEEVGAIVVATGYELYPKESLGEYGYGKIPDVIDGLTFERLLSASGPTGGEVRRPSDGKVPKEVVFIQCAGSRDKEYHKPYCSKICCMYTAKHAMLYKHKVHDGQAYVFYIDVRTGGKGYEEFYDRTTEEERVVYLRGKVARVFQEGDKVMVWGVDTLAGKKVEIAADLVVLAMAMVPQPDAKELASKLKIQIDQDNWLAEAHPKLRPVETLTAGLFIAGAAQGPKDIPETVGQASGAASKVLALFSKDTYERDPLVALVDEDLCVGCGVCVELCPYGARELDESGKGRRVVAVNPVLCEGCGACAAGCPSGAITHANFSARQIINMVTPYMED